MAKYRTAQKSKVKGLESAGHGRAGGREGGRTNDGGLDESVRRIFQKAVNAGVCDEVHGCVKEGKEGLVFYARRGEGGGEAHLAVKVFKRIQDFKNRGAYVDGDPRFFKKKFSEYDRHAQVGVWANKEFRNLHRSFLAGVCCPRPVSCKDNVLFMNFLGLDGWPAPTLKEVADSNLQKKKKMQGYYVEVLVALKRLFVCAQLVHGDLSEYNILLAPSEQVRAQVSSDADVDLDGDDAMKCGAKRVVLIDFAQAVSVHHPDSRSLLARDCSRVNAFFKGAGTVLGDEEAVEFVTNSDWQDVGGEEEEVQEESAAGADEQADEDGWTTVSGSAGTLDASEALSETTSVTKSKWRHRAANLRDRVVQDELVALLLSKANKDGGRQEEALLV